MQWYELTIKTSAAGIEPLSARLTALGYDSFVIDDETEFKDFLEKNRACWDYIDESLAAKLRGLSQIRLYIEDDGRARDRISVLRESLSDLKTRYGQDPGPLTISAKLMPEEDWENGWKKNYPPVPVGRNLMVLPCWLDRNAAQGRLPIVLDPGLTFGTGAHPSTQMCMCRLEERIHGGERVIDLGSGSGILSICALNLGAASAIGVDIDPKAEDIARENAAYNGIGSDRFTALTCDLIAEKARTRQLSAVHYDIVLVNIVADVIIGLSPVLPAFLGETSVVVASGILDTRLGDVTAALERVGLTVLETHAQEDWRCVVAALAPDKKKEVYPC